MRDRTIDSQATLSISRVPIFGNNSFPPEAKPRFSKRIRFLLEKIRKHKKKFVTVFDTDCYIHSALRRETVHPPKIESIQESTCVIVRANTILDIGKKNVPDTGAHIIP